MKNSTQLQRRSFLKKLAILTGGSSLFAQQSQMKLISSVLASPADYTNIQDYKSLVCIFLNGGNDAFNMFVPMQTEDYSHYRDLRQTLAISKNKLLPVNGVEYGFHPKMSAVQNLYNQGRISLVSNLGNLVKPLTKQQYLDAVEGADLSNFPPALFSHSDQINFWQTSSPTRSVDDIGDPTGWGGRLADMLAGTNGNDDIPSTISLDRFSLWQRAQNSVQLTVNRSGGLDDFAHMTNRGQASRDTSRSDAWTRMLEMQRSHGMEQQVSGNFQRVRQRIATVKAALASSEGMIETPYDGTSHLSTKLRMVARMIYAREQLGIKRQIFFVEMGGYDTHGGQLGKHQELFRQLNEGLNSFNLTMEELNEKGIASIDSVTTFSSSEFGRTLGSNGSGTDHGWGSHHLVMGGAVNGGLVHGELPSLAAGSSDDIGNAILPKIATDQYGATLGKWLGVSDSDLLTIFPNLGNFAVRDLGFMS